MIEEIDLLKSLLNYDPETGIFTWSRDIGARAQKDAVAGSINLEGYRRIRIAGKYYLAHRVAFLFMTGRWPTTADHMNGVRDDNRWTNLREVTRSQSAINAERKAGASGLRGVNFNPKLSKWQARIRCEGYRAFVGLFATKEEAYAAYLESANELHGDYAVHNRPSQEN